MQASDTLPQPVKQVQEIGAEIDSVVVDLEPEEEEEEEEQVQEDGQEQEEDVEDAIEEVTLDMTAALDSIQVERNLTTTAMSVASDSIELEEEQTEVMVVEEADEGITEVREEQAVIVSPVTGARTRSPPVTPFSDINITVRGEAGAGGIEEVLGVTGFDASPQASDSTIVALDVVRVSGLRKSAKKAVAGWCDTKSADNFILSPVRRSGRRGRQQTPTQVTASTALLYYSRYFRHLA